MAAKKLKQREKKVFFLRNGPFWAKLDVKFGVLKTFFFLFVNDISFKYPTEDIFFFLKKPFLP